MTPALALRRLEAVSTTPQLLERPRSDVAHVGARRAPTCGQRGKRWRLADRTTRRLCKRCSAWVERHTPDRTPTAAELALAALEARTLADVDALVWHAIAHQGATATTPTLAGGPLLRHPLGTPLPLHTHLDIARARIRAEIRDRSTRR